MSGTQEQQSTDTDPAQTDEPQFTPFAMMTDTLRSFEIALNLSLYRKPYGLPVGRDTVKDLGISLMELHNISYSAQDFRPFVPRWKSFLWAGANGEVARIQRGADLIWG
ncbi:hypothetical protein I302_103356 [Kwoniella bestiolae CBS 10118]|uniref:Uncharacterized protein n=1 Tax=Kwoniella bestiolae CBS 10118 TaxID=1296100 RepID=A0A1B9G867_9TREE|nr:hypothetical protein I302_02057 [Kwoniella bestiolae CBS 10118]OCF27218.1 hypothetical protein I302_02057 [Kwoniella bestiolae CBS 10118]